MTSRERSPLRAVVLVLTVTVVVSVVLAVLHVPSVPLFGSLVGGMAHALSSTTPLAVPPAAYRLGQALIGVTIGSLVSLSALAGMGADLAPIVAVTLGTVAISLAAGRVLARRSDVSPVTGAFAMIAGGASGVVAVARELGADDRVVTVVQYLRVFVVLLTMPLVTLLVFRPSHGHGGLADAHAGVVRDLVFVAVSLAVGLALARLV